MKIWAGYAQTSVRWKPAASLSESSYGMLTHRQYYQIPLVVPGKSSEEAATHPAKRGHLKGFSTCRNIYKWAFSPRSPTSSLVVKHSFNNKQKPEKYMQRWTYQSHWQLSLLFRLTENPLEEELEKNLIHVDERLESIRNIAIDIDVQLRIQEPKIDRIQILVRQIFFVLL